jgi:hypothetical protein
LNCAFPFWWKKKSAKAPPPPHSAASKKIADIPSLAISDEATRIAILLLTKGAVPQGSEEDALHIGISAAQGVDFLLTWNFKHINNAETKAAIVRLVESCGFTCPQLCSPEELGGMNDD